MTPFRLPSFGLSSGLLPSLKTGDLEDLSWLLEIPTGSQPHEGPNAVNAPPIGAPIAPVIVPPIALPIAPLDLGGSHPSSEAETSGAALPGLTASGSPGAPRVDEARLRAEARALGSVLRASGWRGTASGVEQMAHVIVRNRAFQAVMVAADLSLQPEGPNSRVLKPRSTALEHTVQFFADGGAAVWMKVPLGEGGYKRAKEAIYVFPKQGDTERAVAAAKLSASLDHETRVQAATRERHLLSALSNEPYFVRDLESGVRASEKQPGLMRAVSVQPRYGRTLADALETDPSFRLWPQKRFVMRELVDGLGVLHDRGLAHLDLKPANIFVGVAPTFLARVENPDQPETLRELEPRVRIGDFGLATPADVPTPQIFTTPTYLCPEFAGRLHEGWKVSRSPQVVRRRAEDVFALGLIFSDLEFGTLPTLPIAERDAGYAQQVRARRRTTQALVDQAFESHLRPAGSMGELIYKMISVDPGQRPTVKDVRHALSEIELRESRAMWGLAGASTWWAPAAAMAMPAGMAVADPVVGGPAVDVRGPTKRRRGEMEPDGSRAQKALRAGPFAEPGAARRGGARSSGGGDPGERRALAGAGEATGPER